MKVLSIILLLATILLSDTIITGEVEDAQEILSSSEVLIDKSKALSIKDIEQKTSEFQENHKSRLSYGYSPNFNVWIKVTIQNTSERNVSKILEYTNPLTTHIDFYEPGRNRVLKDGLFQIDVTRKSLNPYFEINLESFETKTFYIKASSKITTMIIGLNLYNTHAFYNKELRHQSILQLFFGAMIILALYNFFVFMFTKDISYLFYVLYVVGVIFHQIMYTGIAYIYIFNEKNITSVIEYSILMTAVPIMFLALFLKFFLKTSQYKRIDKTLNGILIFMCIYLLAALFTYDFGQYRNIPSMVLLTYLIAITIYAVLKKNRQAYFILVGWVIMFSAIVLMYLNSLGVFSIDQYVSYFAEIAFLSEALLFSIALADKINHLQLERDESNTKLIAQQKSEKMRLKVEVEKKTKELQIALQQQTTLLKELNHRVKNNMQTIISLVQLQADEIEDESTRDIFITIQNRISAMTHLHELLYKQKDITQINTYEYFERLVDNLQNSYDTDVQVTYNIQVNLEVEPAISCGLILNELLINSFKYAFDDVTEGVIFIELFKEEDTYIFNVSDNGKGYNLNQTNNSFGLTLVNTFVNDYLHGSIEIVVNNGVFNQIKWRDND